MLGQSYFHTASIQQPVSAQLLWRQQIARPRPEWPAQPLVDRNAKAGLRPVDEIMRPGLIEPLPDQPFAAAVADLHAGRNSGGEFHHILVEKWHPGFQRDRHRSAI